MAIKDLTTHQSTTVSRFWLGVLTILALVGLGYTCYEGFVNGAKPLLVISSLFFGFFSFGHAIYLLGWRRALAFFGLTVVISFVMETLSIATCLATCYDYTSVLGPRLGLVPAVIPVSWFTMSYACYIIVNLICENQPVSTKGGGVWMMCLAFLTALVMTAWDLTLDPYMVLKEKAWIWQTPGAYFGIPMANYVVWVETTFMIGLVYRLTERNLVLKPLGSVTPLVISLPLIVYAIMSLPDLFIGVPVDTRLLPIFTMVTPLFIAASRLKPVAS